MDQLKSEVKIKSLKKMMDVLNCFIEKQPLGVTEISEALGLYKSNVHNILNTMVAMDYLEQDKLTGKYYLGVGVVKLSRAVGNRFSFHAPALKHMQVISDEVNEIVYLGVPMKNKIYYLDAIIPSNAVVNGKSSHSITNFRDSVEMLHCTGGGKAILAYMPAEEREEYLRLPLEGLTERSITDPDVLRRELQAIRDRGYSIDDEEVEIGTRCVAVPIRARDGSILGAMSISGRVDRMTPDKYPKYAEILKAHVHDIEDGI